MFQFFINNLIDKLQKPLPGTHAQFELAHINRQKIELNSKETKLYKPSAVLILLYPNHHKKTSILLIERTTYNGHHSGQIAFPGGKAELTDSSLEETALREFFEETGSNETPIIIGKLTPVYIPVSGFMVQPFVSYIHQKPTFLKNNFEVNLLIEWEVDQLLNSDNLKETTIEPITGSPIKTPYFDVNGKVLWGATAMMLNELKWLLK